MRAGAILAVAVLSLMVGPRTAGAQCGAFGAACSGSGKSIFHVDFRAQKDVAKKPVQPLHHSVNPVPPIVMGSTPIDCGMIKRVDPLFKSAMPVVRPDPKVQLPMTTIQPPACKG